MLTLLSLFLSGACTTEQRVDPVDESPAEDSGLCSWVDVRPERANCSVQTNDGGFTYNELGQEVTVSGPTRVAYTNVYDERGRLEAVEDADGAQTGFFAWEGCGQYVHEYWRGDDITVEESVTLTEGGQIRSKTTRTFWLGQQTDETQYTSTWDSDRILSGEWSSPQGVFQQDAYVYGSDEYGRFETQEEYRPVGTLNRTRTTWYDDLGRVVRTLDHLTRGRPDVSVTSYDGDAIDATATTLMGFNEDGEPERRVTTRFLPDGRIQEVETQRGTRPPTIDTYLWQCPEAR